MTVTDQFRAARDRLLESRTDYDSARRDFRWPRFEHFNFGLDWFDAVAADPQRADTEALVIVEKDGTETRRTWRELSRRSSQVASWLRDLGVKPLDRMIVMLGNQVQLWEVMLAGIKLGAVLIPTTTQMGPADLQDRVARGGASWAVANAGDLAKFAAVSGELTLIAVDGAVGAGEAAGRAVADYTGSHDAPEDFRPQGPTPADQTLLLYFTSGTTSKAKLVEHTHTSYPVGHLSTMYWIGLEPGDVHLNVASPGWAKHAWSNIFTPWIAEATVFIYNYDRFDPSALMGWMEREKVSSFCAPPTVWRMLVQADLTQLQNPPSKVVSAGEPLNAEVIEQVQRAWGRTVRDGFGQTETTVQVANTPGQKIKMGAMGRPLPGYHVVLIDPVTGEEARLGELCLRLGEDRPVGLMTRYHGDEARTDEVMRDGLYHTGDIAERDDHGILTYVGRGDDVFKSSDYRLSPFELESVVIGHPAVAEVAVVPSPDPLRLSVPKAFVVLAAGHTPGPELAEDILGFCRENLAPFKRIRRLEFAELPKTISGKIRRVELRRAEELRQGGAGDAASPDVPAAGDVSRAAGHEERGTEYRDTDFPRLSARG